MGIGSLIFKSASRVLLIEDDLDTAALTTHWLRGCGFATEFAETRNLALEHLKNHRFLFILMDYQMPGMSAEEFVPLIRKRYPRSILILTSGESVYEAASNLGISYVLQKPYYDEDLTSMIKRIIEVKGIPEAV